MFLGDKTLPLLLWALKVVAPCAAQFLASSNNPAIANMDAGKKDVLISLLRAINADDSQAKTAMKAAQAEVEKIQGI